MRKGGGVGAQEDERQAGQGKLARKGGRSAPRRKQRLEGEGARRRGELSSWCRLLTPWAQRKPSGTCCYLDTCTLGTEGSLRARQSRS